jgi:hypothetical protein
MLWTDTRKASTIAASLADSCSLDVCRLYSPSLDSSMAGKVLATTHKEVQQPAKEEDNVKV